MTHPDMGLWCHTESPTLDSEASQSFNLNMLPWLLQPATAAQAWLLLPGAGPAYFWGELAATPPPPLQTCRPAQPWPHSPCPCRGPQDQNVSGPDLSSTTFRTAILSTARVELFEFGGEGALSFSFLFSRQAIEAIYVLSESHSQNPLVQNAQSWA